MGGGGIRHPLSRGPRLHGLPPRPAPEDGAARSGGVGLKYLSYRSEKDITGLIIIVKSVLIIENDDDCMHCFVFRIFSSKKR